MTRADKPTTQSDQVHALLRRFRGVPLTKDEISRLLPPSFSDAKADPGFKGILSRILYGDRKRKGGTSRFVKVNVPGQAVRWTCR